MASITRDIVLWNGVDDIPVS